MLQTVKTDISSLQIFANFCTAAAEAMGYTLMRTAHSTFVKETEDFSCGLLTTEGLTFASPRGFGATWFIGLDYGPVIGIPEGYEDGDIWITNDPYAGGVATHTPDFHIWKPVFLQGELICFSAGHIHNTDVGGAVPASLSRTLTEIQQEGIRIPPTRLMRRGELNHELLRIIQNNVRAPRQNLGDLNAQIASVSTGARKILEIGSRLGPAAFKRSVTNILDYAHNQAREVIRSIPNGDYFHAEFADEDAPDGFPCRVALTLRVRDDEIEMDFTGSDPQLASSLNMPTCGHARHALIMAGLGYVLYSLDKNLLLNAGALRVARAILPEGTVVNASFPAAVGMRSLVCKHTQVVTLGAFARAIPQRMCASPAGSQSLVNVRSVAENGRTVMASVGPVGGGAGGMPNADGNDGSGSVSGFLKNTPIEISEAELPVRFLRYGLVPGTGGPGEWRGGCGMVMKFEVFAPQTMVTARNRDHSRFASWGLNGGAPGLSSRFTRHTSDGRALDLANADIVHLEPGDVLELEGPGGGGWGDPFKRDPALVARDVAARLLTRDEACQQYGVVFDEEGLLDDAATEALRRAPRSLRPVVAHNDQQVEFEKLWSPERYDALTDVLSQTAIPWRHWVKKEIFTRIGETPAGADAKLAVYEAFGAVRARFPHLVASAE
ncbi:MULTISPECIES: hydantoinase B/oxoprolinase family protein [unclassified Chelatococcus]|uniref:hydantoinase B/oxoprolinase family protein n=1 Tax=unclassified Chelatococcus TaxID=2638111 RepID=UPI001BCACB4B|nr:MULTISPECIES: hydantoinase B/oxoprolinase family protein [unclassified Chelatococcus]MBS7700258.1 hydantoinase B/oxoprolinase family protein [Chelatococcus sp. YT9]MBX3558229.1 hydantoinase B/oxoprolinase family protein [Chelatococcus sp.]